MRISSTSFLIAAALSVLGAIAHEIVGAPKVLGPLTQTNLPQDVIWLHHFSWHVGTISVLAMAALFILASRGTSGRAIGIIATVMSASFAALGIGLALFGDPVVLSTPAPYPWTIIAILGVVGIMKKSPSQARPH